MIFNWNPALISNWCNHSLSELTFKLKVSNLFWTLGVFLAKTLQDSRLVDLPLSTPFLKLLCQVDLSSKSFKTHFLKRNFIGIENLKNYVMSNCHAKMTLGRGGGGVTNPLKKIYQHFDIGICNMRLKALITVLVFLASLWPILWGKIRLYIFFKLKCYSKRFAQGTLICVFSAVFILKSIPN